MVFTFSESAKVNPPPSDIEKQKSWEAKEALKESSLEVSKELTMQNSVEAKKEDSDNCSEHIAAQTFTFRELAAATKNFRADCLLGEGGFGRVYKGKIEGVNQVRPFFFTFLLFL